MPRFLSKLIGTLLAPIASRTRSKTGAVVRKTEPVQYPTQYPKPKSQGNQSKSNTSTVKMHKNKHRITSANDRRTKLARAARERRQMLHVGSRGRFHRSTRSISLARKERNPMSRHAASKKSKYRSAKKSKISNSRIELVKYSNNVRDSTDRSVISDKSKRQRQRKSQRKKNQDNRSTSVRRKSESKRRSNNKSKSTIRRRDRPRSAHSKRKRKREQSSGSDAYGQKSRRRYRRIRRFSDGKTERQSPQMRTRTISEERTDLVQPRGEILTSKTNPDETNDDPLNVRNLCRSIVRRQFGAPADPRDAKRKRVTSKKKKKKTEYEIRREIEENNRKLSHKYRKAEHYSKLSTLRSHRKGRPVNSYKQQ